jgi:DNA-3-methyladenine glycosylase
VLRLVEVEAYLGPADRASHTWGHRRTARVASMWLGGGHAYVYFVYGMHHCLNVVCGEPGEGTAVLLRAGAPVAGAASMAALRGLVRAPRPGELAGGPARLCEALAIDRSLDGASLLGGDLHLAPGEPAGDGEVARGPRVGVAYAGAAAKWPLRFAIAGHPEASRPRLAAAGNG